MLQSKMKEYRETTKFNLWVQYFFDAKNKQTYGNSTQSALKAYNTTNYKSASVIGHENLVKLRHLSSTFADLEGFGIGERMKIAISKALKGSYSDWHKLLVQIGDFEPDNKIGVVAQYNFDFSNIGAMIAKDRKERGLEP